MKPIKQMTDGHGLLWALRLIQCVSLLDLNVYRDLGPSVSRNLTSDQMCPNYRY